jgi:hypothetical protein
MKRLLSIWIIALLLISCSNGQNGLQFNDQGREVPSFNSENAYSYIESQLSFGPRVPGSDAHRDAVNYFRNHFLETAGQRSVFVQQFEQEIYGETLPFYNILASSGTEYTDRIILAAHWDSRPRGEYDSENPDLPIPGADDGGSGVGVLMELANIFSENPPPIGVDLILFDGEDYGEEGDLANYFIGSRYWSQNPPVPGYNPRFGILLDMVGGQGAVFPKEGHSVNFAPQLVDEIWSIAAEKGHGDLFTNEKGGRVADDHIIVEQYTGIPMINIIHHRLNESGEIDFPPYWHSQQDDIDIIDRDVLQAVGDVMLELIYNRIPTD